MAIPSRAEVDRLAGIVSRHVLNHALHSSGLVIEQLSGNVNGTNRSFFSSRVPVAGSALVIFRRLVLVEGDGVTYGGHGRRFILDATPSIAGGQVDLAPTVLYLAAREQGPELSAGTLGAFPRAPHEAYFLPAMAQPRRPPRAR